MSKCNCCGIYADEPLSFDNYEEKFCSMRCFDQFVTRGYKPTEKSGCFVATACLGDYNHPVVLDLRRFRDEFLKRKTWGRHFMLIFGLKSVEKKYNLNFFYNFSFASYISIDC